MAGVNQIVTRGYGLSGTRYIPTRGYLGAAPTPPPTTAAIWVTTQDLRRRQLLGLRRL